MRIIIAAVVLLSFASPRILFAEQKIVAPNNVILYFPMKERSGTKLSDQSSFNSTGTLIGATPWVVDAGGYATTFGTATFVPSTDGAIYVSGTNGNRIEVAPISRLNFNAADFSILLDASFEPKAANTIIMFYIGGTGGGCGGVSGWGLWQQDDATAGGVVISVANCSEANNFRPRTSNSVIADNFVHEWVITRTGNSLVFYRDGTLVGTDTMTGNFGDAGTMYLNIGDGQASIAAGHFVGKFAGLVIWNKTLSANEVAAQYAMRFGRTINSARR